MANWIEVSRAHAAVAKAIKDGNIIKQPCEVCKSEDAEAHHEDYSKPLDVRWLCRSHHRQRHMEIGHPLMDHWTVMNIRGVPIEVVRDAKIRALDLNVSLKDLVIAAVEAYCKTTIEPVRTVTPVRNEKMITSAKQACDHHAIGEDEKPIAREAEKPADSEKSAKAGRCPKCDGPTIPWGPMRRCPKCLQNWPV